MNRKVQRLIQESKILPNDSRRNNELVKLLRKESNSDVFEAVKQMADMRCVNAIRVAKRVLNEKEYVKKFFWHGLDLANASSIEFWLDFSLPKLGSRSVMRMLKNKKNERPEIIGYALYFLPSLLEKKDYSSIKDLKTYNENYTLNGSTNNTNKV